ncbi:MAG TPA: hypothetical protein VIQ30_23050 [Pseudonocardia sp.]
MSDDNVCLDCGQERRPREGARGLCKSCYYKRHRRGLLDSAAKRNRSFEEHLAAIVPDENGCWPWPGNINPGGYGMTGKETPAHVQSYRHHIGPVPKKHDVGHACHDKDETCQDWRTCTHRRCINPEHLIAQTRSENLLARPHRKTHCKRGHELIPENVYVIPQTGSRQCLLCVPIARAALSKRKREQRRQAEIAARTFATPVPGVPDQRSIEQPAEPIAHNP